MSYPLLLTWHAADAATTNAVNTCEKSSTKSVKNIAQEVVRHLLERKPAWLTEAMRNGSQIDFGEPVRICVPHNAWYAWWHSAPFTTVAVTEPAPLKA